jgi:transcriptional regulator of met regulon
VKLNINCELPVERVRLAFYAVETIPPFDIAPGVLRTAKNTLFSIQQTLWDSKQQSLKLDQKSDYTFPFTIQMPMVQFPPSVDHATYRCSFQLIALLDTPSLGIPIIKTDIPVICMPFVETSLLKTPTVLSSKKGDLSARVKMGSQQFVPGDIIPFSLHVVKSSNSKKSSNLQYITVNIKLVQILKVLAFDDIHDQITPVATATQKILLLKSFDGSYCDADLTLKLPADITPSYDYGKLVQISYKLEVHVEQKGPMCGIWNYSVGIDDIDITIGTLGYGIRTSNELKLYSEFADSASDKPSTMPLPKFMKAIEYEDALPLYDSSKLPAYDHISSSSNQVMIM